MKVLNGFTAWPDHSEAIATDRIVEMYRSGYAGAFQDPELSQALDDQIVSRGGVADGNWLATEMGFADDGAGKLSLHFPSVVETYGYEGLTWPGQETGDCVSMCFRDLGLMTVCIEAKAGLPDERTGKVEQPPVVSDTARRNGVFSNEGIYLARMHSGQGMTCSEAAAWLLGEGGLILRQKYEQADLEKYNVKFELPGSKGSPEWLDKIGRLHPVYDWTRPKGEEAIRDFIHRGKPTGVCAGLGFSDQRGEWGLTKLEGSWAHSWHLAGYDDRQETKEHFGFPLCLAGHRWAKWNRGDRRVYKSAALVPEHLRALWKSLGMLDQESGDILIPEGYWWFDARLLRKVAAYSSSGANGWAAAKLPDFMGGWT